MVTGAHRYIMAYPNGDMYDFPVLTKHHMDGCRNGDWTIFDLETNRDCIRGAWIQNQTHGSK